MVHTNCLLLVVLFFLVKLQYFDPGKDNAIACESIGFFGSS